MDDQRFQDILSNRDQRFSYSVSTYIRGLSSMLVRVKELGENKEIYFYTFYTPDYFEGSMAWSGSGFYKASNEELDYYINKLHPHSDKNWRKAFAEEFALLKSDTDGDGSIKIIATSADRHDNVPHDFRSIVGNVTW